MVEYLAYNEKVSGSNPLFFRLCFRLLYDSFNLILILLGIVSFQLYSSHLIIAEKKQLFFCLSFTLILFIVPGRFVLLFPWTLEVKVFLAIFLFVFLLLVSKILIPFFLDTFVFQYFLVPGLKIERWWLTIISEPKRLEYVIMIGIVLLYLTMKVFGFFNTNLFLFLFYSFYNQLLDLLLKNVQSFDCILELENLSTWDSLLGEFSSLSMVLFSRPVKNRLSSKISKESFFLVLQRRMVTEPIVKAGAQAAVDSGA